LVKQDQPEAFGVVKLNANNEIVELVEKTSDFVSEFSGYRDLLFQRSQYLKNELQLVLTIISFTEANNQINDGIK
jgi:glucose-1-phosphate thymidylyltransferase